VNRHAGNQPNLMISPTRLFVYAQAFRFSSGRGRCFSPGLRTLLSWYIAHLQRIVIDRAALKRLRLRIERA